MKGQELIVNTNGVEHIVYFCKKCREGVFLKESLMVYKDGSRHIRGSCPSCGSYLKNVGHSYSRLFKELNNASNMEFTVTNGKHK